jgi:hypothetical protein
MEASLSALRFESFADQLLLGVIEDQTHDARYFLVARHDARREDKESHDQIRQHETACHRHDVGDEPAQRAAPAHAVALRSRAANAPSVP